MGFLGLKIGDRHVPLSLFSEVWDRNKEIGIWLLEEALRLKDEEIKPALFNEQILLDEETQTYLKPRESAVSHKRIESGTVQADQVFNDWYRIDTNEGKRWINVPKENKYFPERPFVDISAGFWAIDEIKHAKEMNWMVGVTDETFIPNDFTTRAQIAVILSRILNLPLNDDYKGHFEDIKETFWAYREVEAVMDHGIFSGYEDGRFRPGSPITREQIAVVLARIIEKDLERLEGRPFADVSENHWAKAEIQLMKDKGIFGGYSNGSFGIGDYTTRSQVAALLNRIEENVPSFFE